MAAAVGTAKTMFEQCDECGQPLLTDDELEYVYVALEWAAGQGYTWMRPGAERQYKMPTLRQAFNKIADKLKLPRVEQLIDKRTEQI
jgi:hypothetical protein